MEFTPKLKVPSFKCSTERTKFALTVNFCYINEPHLHLLSVILSCTIVVVLLVFILHCVFASFFAKKLQSRQQCNLLVETLVFHNILLLCALLLSYIPH